MPIGVGSGSVVWKFHVILMCRAPSIFIMQLIHLRAFFFQLCSALVFCACTFPPIASAELRITEFMASNKDVISDEDDDASDWIELFNSGAESVDLDGYHLTDDPGALTKWRFPAMSLDAGEFLLVFASEKNRRVPGAELHTNFTLSSSGEYLALVAPDGSTVVVEFGPVSDPLPEQFEDVSYGLMQTGDTTNSVLLRTAANCTVLVPSGGSLGDTWTVPDFDDSSWDAAVTGIGYDENSTYLTQFGAGGNLDDALNGVNTSVYIRVPFDATDASSIAELTLRMKYDDGFIAFLNGTRVADGNAPEVAVWDSEATTDNPDGSATTFEDFSLTESIALLRNGSNVLAIQGLNGDLGSSDMLAVPELHALRVTNPSIGGPGYLAVPSPGAFNGETFGGFVSDTTFSVKRGFFDAPFDVEITTATEGATIRYTTNGDPPSANRGAIYSGPINIARTTPLRAIAVKEGMVSTNIDTQTYIFVDDVVTQSSSNTESIWDLPSSWGGTSPDYGMDPRVVDNRIHRETIREDLKRVPTLSIVMDASAMFGGNGIYANPGSSGSNWERACSMEIIDPATIDGSMNAQIDCGIRIQGGAFRSFGLTRKKSFRVLFKGIYGPTKLRYPFFGRDAADEFDTLTFRMESNDGYQWGNRSDPQYARDEFGRRSQLAMGSPSPHGRYMHLYINGVYWGVYNTVERPDASFGAAYFGADKDQWDGINSGRATNEGSTAPWNTLVNLVEDITSADDEAARTEAFMRARGLNPDGTNNPGWESYIDIDNYIDYLLVNWYSGNNDWPHKNYYCGRARGPESEGFKFFGWDAEWSLFMNSSNDKTGTFSGVAEPQEHLRNSLEYRLRFGDRAHRALFNDGPLTPQRCIDRYDEIVVDHRSILVPELARWGDQHGTLRTMNDWEDAYQRIVDDWLSVRTPSFVNVLRSASLYPETDAPVFSQHGGSVSADTPVAMVTNADRIYYTFDGSDPRLLGGAVNPAAEVVSFGGGGPVPMTFMTTGHVWKYLDDGSNQRTAWRASEFDDDDWASGPSQLGYGDDSEDSGTGLSFGPDSGSKFPTTYFRTKVDIPDPSIWDHILMRVKYDDGAAFYVNGSEVERANLSSNAAFDDFANGTVSDENSWKDFEINTTRFVAGINTIAVEVHQGSGSSSDIRLDMILRGEISRGGGANVSDPLFFAEPGMLRARSFSSGTGEWSAINEAFFTIDTVPADSSNLIVSEFNYHPADPATLAETSVSSDRDDFEFAEMMNIGGATIDLTGVSFKAGINFEFPRHSLLGAGERLLLVRNRAAFDARYGAIEGVQVFEYTGRLSNDGETLLLSSDAAGVVREFTYNDQEPWPTAADGEGVSLVLVDPASNPDHADVSNWRAGIRIGGTPGSQETLGTSYAEWATLHGITGGPDGDHNGDGVSNIFAYLFAAPTGRAPLPKVAVRSLSVGGGQPVDFLTLSYRLNLDATEVAIAAEISEDLVSWDNDSARTETVSTVENGDGTATVTLRLAEPIGSDGAHLFLRLGVR